MSYEALFRSFTHIQPLGTGRIVELFRAADRLTGRAVFLKVLKSEAADPAERARFFHGAELQSRVRHPNILPVLDLLTEADAAAIVMPFVPGGALQDALPAGIGLAFPLAAAYGQDLCAGVRAIHACGIVHGDLKPLNLLISAEGRLKISDFGEARRIDEPLPAAPAAIVNGSPYYMPPECARGYAPVPASDWYSVGAILYRIFCGRTVFEGQDAGTVMRAHVDETPPDPLQFRPDLPYQLAESILLLLSKDPAPRLKAAERISAVLAGSSREKTRNPQKIRAAVRQKSTIKDRK